MTNFSQFAQATAQNPFSSSAVQAHPLGELAVTNDGRKFRYVLNGGVAMIPGSLYMSPVVVANHQNMATATAAIGAKTISVTLGATAVTANQYRGAYLVINAGTGLGLSYKIASHPAAALSTAVVLTLEDPIITATAVADTKSCLIYSPFQGVIASVNTAKPAGVAVYAVAANEYGWLQTHGVCSGLNQAATAVNLGLAASTTSGAMETVAATTSQIATALQAGVTTECRAIFIRLE